MTPVMKAIKERRSVRRFTQTCPTREQLEPVLEAAVCAPTGMNLQSSRFIAVRDPDVLSRLERLLARELNRPGYNFYGAPVLILAANPKDGRNAMADCAAALQNMMLAAHEAGLGSCWINQFRDLWDNAAVAEFLAGLGLPQNYAVQCSLAVGFPAEMPAPPPRKEGRVTYIG